MKSAIETFRDNFNGNQPTHVVHAPGRVNLMGEHIDYAGLSVFPMALDRGITLCFSPRADGLVRVVNSGHEFSSREFDLASDISPNDLGDWGNYIKAAAQGLVREFGVSCGMDASISSTLPVASGLSSSAALVIAVSLALLEVNTISVDTLVLAEVLARAEKYVGTQGGGMDQAIVLGAQAGAAMRIDFEPLKLTPTAIPKDWRFIIASSLVKAEKSGAAKDAYNERVRQTKEALRTIMQALYSNPTLGEYKDLLDRYPIQELVDIAGDELSDVLYRRFMHVITEATRARQAEIVMGEGDIESFGGLMSESHASLRNEFEVSCPELDSLVAHAEEGGAVGARLTGAGFGGCVVALSEESTVAELTTYLSKTFYSARGVTDSLEDVLFVARPAAGAFVAPI